MAKTRRQESAAARRERLTRYATAGSIAEAQGPHVFEGQLPISGQVILWRRVDLAHVLREGVWPEPITAAVRRMIVHPAVRWLEDDADVLRTYQAVAAIARAAVIVPPPQLLEGDVTVEQITPAMCVPLFVEPGAEPGEGQTVLRTPGLHTVDIDGVSLHPFDLSWLAVRVLETVPGALANFRGRPPDALESVEPQEGDGPQDGRAAGADAPA